ncbi:MAG: hypothetical protein F6K65_43850, partial [Moorea sp. SIO3C2]|nr:hypothetical protein [Moorena sp. SIO3C2]
MKHDENDAVHLLQHLNQVAQANINTDNLRSLWMWADQVTSDVSQSQKITDKRANALYRAF